MIQGEVGPGRKGRGLINKSSLGEELGSVIELRKYGENQKT